MMLTDVFVSGKQGAEGTAGVKGKLLSTNIFTCMHGNRLDILSLLSISSAADRTPPISTAPRLLNPALHNAFFQECIS